MSYMSEVNEAIHATFPGVKVTAVATPYYVYFTSSEHTTQPKDVVLRFSVTPVHIMARSCIESVRDWLNQNRVSISAPELQGKVEKIRDLAAQIQAQVESIRDAQAKTSRNQPEDGFIPPTYTREQHQAIANLIKCYTSRNEKSGQRNATFEFDGMTHDNEVMVLVKDLDALCGLESKYPEPKPIIEVRYDEDSF